MKARTTLTAAAVVIQSMALVLSSPAMAHHPMGGTTPATLMQGLLSGVGHPIIGLDHLAFIVGIGLLAGIAGHGMLLPVLFVIAMTAGLGLHLAGLALPYGEVLVAISVVLVGLALTRQRTTGRGPWLEAAAFGLAGLLHGHAFAEAVIGSEVTPLAGYIVGLAITQLMVAYAAYMLGHGGDATAGRPLLSPIMVRIAGVAIFAVGAAFTVLGSGLIG